MILGLSLTKAMTFFSHLIMITTKVSRLLPVGVAHSLPSVIFYSCVVIKRDLYRQYKVY